MHDDLRTEFWIDLNDVLLTDFPVEVVEDRGGSLVVVRLPGPGRGPEVGGYGSHGGRVGGSGSIFLGAEGGKTGFSVGEGAADALEVVGFKFGGGKVFLKPTRLVTFVVSLAGDLRWCGRGSSGVLRTFKQSTCTVGGGGLKITPRTVLP